MMQCENTKTLNNSGHFLLSHDVNDPARSILMKSLATSGSDVLCRIMEGKREEAIKDRFVAYLRATGDLDWRTKALDVPARNGRKNLDYLLQSDNQTLALEITTRNDEQESLAHNSQSIAVWNQLCPLIRADKLGGCTWFRTPNSYPMSSTKVRNIIKQYGEEIARMIEELSFTLRVGDERAVETKLGQFVVGRVEGPPSLLPPMTWRGWDWKTAEAEYQDSLELLKIMIVAKNEQLDTDADRRILLIVDNAPFGKPQFREAVSDFFNQVHDEMNNIDEVFIEFSENAFEKVYDSRDKRDRREVICSA